MKKYIIASSICLVPLVILGIVNPLSILIVSPKNIDVKILAGYIFVLSICVTVVFSTMMMILRHADHIDRLEEQENNLFKRQTELNNLILKYNSLIIDQSK